MKRLENYIPYLFRNPGVGGISYKYLSSRCFLLRICLKEKENIFLISEI